MTADQPSALVPRLRFPEFRSEPVWEQISLGKAFKTITNGTANAQDHQEDGSYPLFDRSDIVKRSPEFMFDAKAVILPGEGMKFTPRYFNGKFNLHQRCYALMEPSIDWRFAFHALDRFKDALANSAVMSTVLSLRMPIIENFTIPCPKSNAEQQKIADSLDSLDDLIAAEGRKLEALRQHKQGLMQQLFPQPGETLPIRRFSKFKNGPKWQYKMLPAIATNLSSSRIPITEQDRISGEVPYYGASGVVDYVKDHIFEEDLLCVSEDGANLVSRTYPIAFSISGKTWVNNHAHVLRFDRSITQLLVQAYLNYIDVSNYLTGMAQPKLNRAMLDSIPIALPPTHHEENDVAGCIASLDQLLSMCHMKIKSLSIHKQGLLQKLFPS